MKKIKDRVLLGSLAGFVGSGVVMAMQEVARNKGWMAKTWAQQAEGAVVSRKYLKTQPAAALGWLTGLFVNAFYGIAQTYVYSKTGRDHFFVKATSLGVFSWIVLHGLSSRLTYAFKPKDSPPYSSSASLLTALLDSYISGATICSLGDDQLFPDQTSNQFDNVREAPPNYQVPYRLRTRRI